MRQTTTLHRWLTGVCRRTAAGARFQNQLFQKSEHLLVNLGQSSRSLSTRNRKDRYLDTRETRAAWGVHQIRYTLSSLSSVLLAPGSTKFTFLRRPPLPPCSILPLWHISRTIMRCLLCELDGTLQRLFEGLAELLYVRSSSKQTKLLFKKLIDVRWVFSPK